MNVCLKYETPVETRKQFKVKLFPALSKKGNILVVIFPFPGSANVSVFIVVLP